MNTWQKHLAAQERSGKSVSGYCREHGIDPKRLYYWQRKHKGAAAGRVEFVEIKKPGRGNFELRVRDGAILIIPEQFEPEQLRRLLEALEC
jgi:transposase-like protein